MRHFVRSRTMLGVATLSVAALALAGCLVLLTLPLTALLRPVITRAAAPAAAET